MKSTSALPAAARAAEADASTRQRVAAAVLEHGPSTAAGLAAALGLTPAAIRRHLDVLLENGHVEAREQRVYGARGRGRPAKVFALTDAGRTQFYSAYDALAISALEFVASTAGPDGVTSFARSRVEGLGSRYRERAATEPVPATQQLADTLTDEGYVASLRPSAAGEQLCQHHCPVAHVAERFPQLCEAETELFSQLLGVHVQRLATIAHGDGVCTTHIPRSSGPTRIPRSSGPADIPRSSGPTHIPRASQPRRAASQHPDGAGTTSGPAALTPEHDNHPEEPST